MRRQAAWIALVLVLASSPLRQAEAAGLDDLAPERIETLEGGELTVKLWLARKRASAEQTVHEVKAA